MAENDKGGWREMASADRSGQRILATVRGGEQGPAEVDTIRWTRPQGHDEYCWIATDTGESAPVTYEDDDLVAWMPLPTPVAGRSAPAEAPIEPADERDFLEESGSGI